MWDPTPRALSSRQGHELDGTRARPGCPNRATRPGPMLWARRSEVIPRCAGQFPPPRPGEPVTLKSDTHHLPSFFDSTMSPEIVVPWAVIFIGAVAEKKDGKW